MLAVFRYLMMCSCIFPVYLFLLYHKWRISLQLNVFTISQNLSFLLSLSPLFISLFHFLGWFSLCVLSVSLYLTPRDGNFSPSLLLSIFYNYFLFSFPISLPWIRCKFFLYSPSPLLSLSLPSSPSHSHKHTLSPPISLSECHEKRQRKRGGI